MSSANARLIAAALAGLVGASSGVLAQAVGYVPLFLLAGTLGLVALGLLRYALPPPAARTPGRPEAVS
jgi:MFS superfamily sulfate permease-like transporter